MIAGLLDTSVLVDILRRHPPAEKWLGSQHTLGVTVVVWFELLEGSANRPEHHRVLRVLKPYELIDPISDDVQWALLQLIKYRLSHNVDSMDCLIAAPATRLQIPLYTQNLKHFALLLGDLARKPD